MTTFKGLWVDNNHPIPDDLTDIWTQARSIHEALIKLELIDFDEVSINTTTYSKYGNNYVTGSDIVVWLNERRLAGDHVPSTIHVHSDNSNYYNIQAPAQYPFQQIV